MLKGNALKKNMTDDKIFLNNDTINIIDNYNIVDISNEATEFFRDSFTDVGCKNINIFFSCKKVPGFLYDDFCHFAEEYHSDDKYLNFICNFLHIKVVDLLRNPNILMNPINLNKLNNAIHFIDEFNSIGINVTLVPYYSFNIKPPFHGRYWLTNEKGYIVDASLNTYSKGMIFAQLMDDDNFNIINGFYHEMILSNLDNSRIVLNRENITEFRHSLEYNYR